MVVISVDLYLSDMDLSVGWVHNPMQHSFGMPTLKCTCVQRYLGGNV
jgi:hypothetical protein